MPIDYEIVIQCREYYYSILKSLNPLCYGLLELPMQGKWLV